MDNAHRKLARFTIIHCDAKNHDIVSKIVLESAASDNIERGKRSIIGDRIKV